ncbi:low density lipoprotein receptor adapter protein 1a isoform X2 [Pangasianodon hypophthalmus]|uniref:low density lipoprotein receptor adapter protein 1a isoform X2 n=1 Tax=Pangasianodon hypophthalmus TaxID=310915 RepID=UPI000EFFA335|nr:low density lipoprotein receptor adapter protein 1a isoform X2 [Pangasianodon hypophthalmus]
MDMLKSARRVIRSPSVSKQPWHTAKHQKLPENWTDTRETLVDGMTFNLRYMGMTLVDQPKGEDVSAAAIKRITATAKAGGKKLLKVALTVSPQKMLIYDRVSNQLIEHISIYRISYCTADKMHDKVFAYIAQNQQNETLECHAFLCAKKKVAQAVTLTVAQAFNVAFESWQLDREEKEQKSGLVLETSNNTQPDISVSLLSMNGTDAVKENLLDFEDCPKVHMENTENLENHVEKHTKTENNINWEVNDGLDEAFSSCSLDSFEYAADLPSPVLTPRSWTLG